MATHDGALVVTFNGEIYNYIELREELRRKGYEFRTNSDTEVLLHGYREWSTDLPSRLKGMFAFALADRQKKELFLARDRFGEKPLFYAEDRESITFASEVRPLTMLSHLDRTMDEEAIAAYLCLNYVPGEATLIRSIRRLLPASWRLYGLGGLRSSGTYWRPPATAPDEAIDEGHAIARLEQLLDQAVALTLRSDVPVGVFLSGGIDSSLVSRSAVRSGQLSRAYCLSVDEASYSEWDGAQETARQLDIPITKVTMGPQALGDFLEIVEHADDPLADSSAVAVWTLSREAARHNKVVLGGDGGDELFGGYLTYKATLWHERVTWQLPEGVRRLLSARAGMVPTSERKVSQSYKLMRFLRAVDLPPAIAHFTWNGTWLPEEASRFVRTPALQESARGALSRLAARHGLPESPSLRQLQSADVSEYLPNDILAKADRMTMAHGLELRAPFLEPDLAEFALRLPARMKTGLMGHPKRILRALAAKAYGVTVARAGKQGFSIPVHGWLRGPARTLMGDLLAPESVRRVDAIDDRAVERAVVEHLSGRRSHGFELWGLMVLLAWHRARVSSVPPIPPVDDSMQELRFPSTASSAVA